MDSYPWTYQCLLTRKKTYIHQLCVDTGCQLKDLPRAMTYKDRWQDRESKESEPSACLDEDDQNVLIGIFAKMPVSKFHIN